MRKPKDWGQPCPNPECFHSRRMRQGNVSAIATYLTQSGKRRIFRCHTCETPFSETRETVFFDLRTSEDKVMMALKMLLVRVDLAGIGFVLSGSRKKRCWAGSGVRRTKPTRSTATCCGLCL